MKRLLGAIALVASAACSAGGEETLETADDAIRIEVKDKATIPLREVSGIALRRRGSATDLIAIGDRTPAIAIGALGPDLDDVAFRTVDLAPALRAARVELATDVQWEAVAADGAGRIVVLEENPGRIFVVDADLSRIEHVIEIEVPARHELAEAWTRDANSRGEGMVLLEGGHVLLLKEKEPRRLVELGPSGDRPGAVRPLGRARFAHPAGARSTMVPLRSWKLADRTRDDFPDLSDLAVGPDGALYVLTDEGRAFGKLGPLDGEEVQIRQKWTLGQAVEKPEGLVLFDERALVASDISGSSHNLFATKKLR